MKKMVSPGREFKFPDKSENRPFLYHSSTNSINDRKFNSNEPKSPLTGIIENRKHLKKNFYLKKLQETGKQSSIYDDNSSLRGSLPKIKSRPSNNSPMASTLQKFRRKETSTFNGILNSAEINLS